ncbi:hypothetical protein ABTH88_20875, partial [Acinetobacter baumannii]
GVKLVSDALFAHATFGRKWSRDSKRFMFLSNIYLAAKWTETSTVAEDFVENYKRQYYARFGDSQDEVTAVDRIVSLGRQARANLS